MTPVAAADLLKSVLALGRQLLGAPNGFIMQSIADNTGVALPGIGVFDTDNLADLPAPIRAVVDRVLDGGQSEVLPDAPGMGALAVAPLRSDAQIVGVVAMAYDPWMPDSGPSRTFGSTELEQLDGLCRLASFALDNARLYGVERHSRLLADRLQDSAQAINESLDLDVVLPRIMERLHEVIEYDSGTIQILERDSMRVIAVRGLPPGECGHVRLLADYPYNRRLVETREPIIEGDVRSAAFWRMDPSLERVWSNLGVPLVVRDRVIGALTIDSHHPHRYTEDDAATAMAFARHAAIAIEHARLFAEAQRELAERKDAQERLHYLANFDPVTGLPNRTLLADRLRQAQAIARRDLRLVGVLNLDLDRFKTVNDTLGHAAGDQLLKAVGQRLVDGVCDGDSVARLAGDEFVLLLSMLDRVQDGAAAAERIGALFADPFHVDGHEIFVSASIGVAVTPPDGSADLEQMLQQADAAMYRAKEEGGNTYRMFTPEAARSAERLDFETEMRHAMDRQEFSLHYQPLVGAESRRVVGVEALLRWSHPTRGFVVPSDIIRLAEETGLIVPLGTWVLGEACRQAKRWQDAGYSGLRVTVNVSARQLSNNLVHTVKTILDETGLEPEGLLLEVTETVVIQNPEIAIATVRELNAVGIAFAIDDFGVGYSSLSQLRRFPIDMLKIDQSFIRDIPAEEGDAGIVTAIIAMAHALGVSVLAEGVETQGQRDFLTRAGCDVLQGYLVGRPLAAPEFEAMFLASGRAPVPVGSTPGPAD
ncbi:MAG: EAL domain-containing protein [Mycobacteriales bacterium]